MMDWGAVPVGYIRLRQLAVRGGSGEHSVAVAHRRIAPRSFELQRSASSHSIWPDSRRLLPETMESSRARWPMHTTGRDAPVGGAADRNDGKLVSQWQCSGNGISQSSNRIECHVSAWRGRWSKIHPSPLLWIVVLLLSAPSRRWASM